MALIYDAPAKGSSEIDQRTLRHHYFAQLASDGKHLVPGMLQQGNRPAVGTWVDVGNVKIDFPVRYFVQYTDFNTLVPGSLIQADRLPEGRWKEIRKPTEGAFYRVVFVDGTYQVDAGITEVTDFAESAEFTENKILPVLELIKRGVFSEQSSTRLIFFYFAGTFDELGGDATQLMMFGKPPSTGGTAVLNLFYDGGYNGIMTIAEGALGIVDFRVQPSAPDGFYSIVYGVLKDDLQLQLEVVDYYVFLENLLLKGDIPEE